MFHREAQARDAQVSDVRYELFLILGRDNKYSGKVIIDFMLSDSQEDLFIDFQGLQVSSVLVNIALMDSSEVNFSGHRVHIPASLLNKQKMNQVVIFFENEYVHNSAGLHQYVDPVDNQMYFYSHLEPFFCHRWFPCFDQPSIRAPLKMRVITPD